MKTFELTPAERSEADRMLAELHEYGYIDRERFNELAPGVRIRHTGHQWAAAFDEGSGYVVAIVEKPNSSWSRKYSGPDIEMVVVWDRPSFGSRLSGVANYHVVAVPGGESRG